jgi:selenocysteine lyase/cysteine desulfurase
LDESREALEDLVNAPRNTVVFVGNATEGVNTVFRNLQWNEDGKDVIIFFSTIYEACAKITDFVVDYFGTSRVVSKEIQLQYPLEDDEIIQRFRNAVAEVEAEGKRARICVFDVVSSKPGVVFPWEELCKVCEELGVLSLVDGAQGVGMVRLDLTKADPDFFTSNCHKWLFVPRGCAMFYVPKRNQHLIATTLATSHGYVPKTAQRGTPLPPKAKSPFVSNFEFTGTKDVSGYLAVKDAIAWRRDTCGGEERILAYLWDLNKRGTKHVAEKLETKSFGE